MRKISTTIYLEVDQLESLKQIVEVTGISMAALIREAVDRVIAVRTGRSSKEIQCKRKRKAK